MVSTEYTLSENYGSLAVGNSTGEYDIIKCQNSTATEVLRIAHDGNVYWRGRLVDSDDEFKQAMLDLAQWFKANMLWNRDSQ